LEIIGPPVARKVRPRVAEAATVAVLGGKLDTLTGLIERAASAYMPITESAPAPVSGPAPVEVPEVTAADLAKLTPEEFRELSSLRWSKSFEHLSGGSPYARGGYGVLSPKDSDGAS
jgi:hypothetical protein